MALTRVWTPSGNYSGGSAKRLLVLHTMEGFTGPNGAYDCAKYFQGNVGASSQVCIDNFHPGKIWECVARNYGAWTQCNYNSVSVSCEQAGYASWSRDKWLNEQSTLLHTTAQWLAEESKKLGIPLTVLTASQAQGGSKGVCQHKDLGSNGCGHVDCGSGYPIDKVIEWAKGGTPAPETEVDMAASVASYEGRNYFAYVGPDNKLRVNGGIVDPDNYCKSGAGITIDQGTGKKTLCFTNRDGLLCTYDQVVGNNAWVWTNKNWQAQ